MPRDTEENGLLYLLSNNVCIVTSVNFKPAIVRPEIDRIGDTRYASLVDLS
jgi:hypothetical protein